MIIGDGLGERVTVREGLGVGVRWVAVKIGGAAVGVSSGRLQPANSITSRMMENHRCKTFMLTSKLTALIHYSPGRKNQALISLINADFTD